MKREEGRGKAAPRVLLGLPFYGFVFVAPLSSFVLLSSKEAFPPAPSVATPPPSVASLPLLPPRPPFDTVFVPGRVEGFDPTLTPTAVRRAFLAVKALRRNSISAVVCR